MDSYSTQTCPHCDHEVDDSQAEWDEGKNTVECDICKKEYTVEPIYKFFGFVINKNCEVCGESDDECYCDFEDTDSTE